MNRPGRSSTARPSARLIAALIAGTAAVLVGTVLGGAGPVLEAIVTPPVPVRVALVGATAVVGIGLLVRAITALGEDERPHSVQRMIRGVRLAFLAVAAFSAAAGWLVGHALPLVVALVVAGVDVVETSFLSIVAARQRDGAAERGPGETPP